MKSSAEMERVLAFLQEYIQKDFSAAVANNMGDAAEHAVRMQALRMLFAEGAGPGLSPTIATNLDEATRRTLQAQAAELRPRTIFKLQRWQHPEQGELYQAYVDSTSPGKLTGYFQSLIIKQVGGALRIVGRYVVCRTCAATGSFQGQRCPDCGSLGWLHREGAKLTSFGTPLETLRLHEPTHPAFLPEYHGDPSADQGGGRGPDAP
jgi:hypothetical protein